MRKVVLFPSDRTWKFLCGSFQKFSTMIKFKELSMMNRLFSEDFTWWIFQKTKFAIYIHKNFSTFRVHKLVLFQGLMHLCNKNLHSVVKPSNFKKTTTWKEKNYTKQWIITSLDTTYASLYSRAILCVTAGVFEIKFSLNNGNKKVVAIESMTITITVFSNLKKRKQ